MQHYAIIKLYRMLYGINDNMKSLKYSHREILRF